MHYFGQWDDPNAALAEYVAVADYLLSGVEPPDPGAKRCEMRDLCNSFLTFKTSLMKSGELSSKTFDRYFATCEMLIEHFGRPRAVESIGPKDFEKLRVVMAERWGPVALANEIQITRSVFKYGFDSELFDKPVRFGQGFNKPPAKALRAARNAKGPRLFTPKEIKALLAEATPDMKAMILLSINGGLGNEDCALLQWRHVDGKWLDYPRAKTETMRP